MKKINIVGLCFLICACATPSQRFDETALELGFSSQILRSKQFQHKIYQTDNLVIGDVLHVYLDGDGTPWKRNRWIAEDPTARNPLILELMKQDKNSAILLGRPCYYGLSFTLGCDSMYWTSHRYSQAVVNSMSSVLNGWLEQRTFKQLTLIGYSGGGSLAILMADMIKGVEKVVTVAANLDVAAWSKHHGYLTLSGSLNPADSPKISQRIKQIHFAGEDDEVVPAFIINEYAQRQENSHYHEIEKQGHACCWKKEWVNLLAIINN